MKLSEIETRSNFLKSVEKYISNIPNGEGLTAQELAEKFGFRSNTTTQKWVRQYPKLKEYIVYVNINSGRQRSAIFVNKKYRDELLKSGAATEIY